MPETATVLLRYEVHTSQIDKCIICNLYIKFTLNFYLFGYRTDEQVSMFLKLDLQFLMLYHVVYCIFPEIVFEVCVVN